MEISCQRCGKVFHVAHSWSAHRKKKLAASYQLRDRGMEEKAAVELAWQRTLASAIRSKTLCYGDPPNVDCCPAGPFSNSEPRCVLEYWYRWRTGADGTTDKSTLDWQRDSSLEIEIEIEPDWVSERLIRPDATTKIRQGTRAIRDKKHKGRARSGKRARPSSRRS